MTRTITNWRSHHLGWLLFTAVLALITSACSAGTANDPCTMLVKYLATHTADFSGTYTGEEIVLTATYQPAALLQCKGLLDKDPDLQDQPDHTAFQYFQLTIGSKDERGMYELIKRRFSKDEQEQTMNYYNYHLGQDLRLVIDNDTIPCTFYHHVQTGGIYKHLLFQMAFETRPIAKEERAALLFQDQVFSTDLHTFHFAGSTISQIPVIK